SCHSLRPNRLAKVLGWAGRSVTISSRSSTAARLPSTAASASSLNSQSACRARGRRQYREDIVSFSILVVDDEPDIAELFRQRFGREIRQGIYVLHFAVSGEEALARLAGAIEPQLIVIVSDINMPGMDGLALLREIKKLHPDLPVMMVTAYGDEER